MRSAPAALPERFELGRFLGRGGAGVVYEVFDRTRGEWVALKAVQVADPDAIYRLKREFRSLCQLEHPNLVRLLDLFVDGETCFFTMELAEGQDFLTFCSRIDEGTDLEDAGGHDEAPPYDEARLREALRGLATGVAALHSHGLLHRDLKPSNVRVTADGRVVLLDFGLATDAHAAALQTHGVAGTVGYMSPEQARGELELTFASDWYSVGAMLYEALTGHLPFEGTAVQILAKKDLEDAPLATRWVPGAPPDLVELAHRLLARNPNDRPKPTAILSELGAKVVATHSTTLDRAGARALLGRDRELAVMLHAYDAIRHGHPRVLLLRGRSGIGKSALVAAFARLVQQRDRAVVLAGRCYEWETVPFKGLDGVVDALSRHLGTIDPKILATLLPPNLSDLGTVFPVLRRHKPIAAAHARRSLVDRPPSTVRASAFAAVRELLARIALRSPLVVVVDDVQWADADTAHALREIVGDATAPPMLLVLASRPKATGNNPVVDALFSDPEKATASEATPRESATAILELGPLSEEATLDLVRRELGEAASEELARLIVRESGGNPFEAGEFIRWAREGATFVADGESLTIDDLVLRRAARLSAEARALLDVVAVAGEPTPAAMALRAAGGSEDERYPLDELRAGQWVRSVRGTAGTLVDTAHDRVRESISDGLSVEHRKTLHRALALALETSETPPHDRLARHFAAAGDLPTARHHAILAARAATETLAFLRASELYELAVQCSTESDTDELLPPWADALARAGRYGHAAEVYLRAARRAPKEAARGLQRHAAESSLFAGKIDLGLDLFERLAGDLGFEIPRTRRSAMIEIASVRARLFFRGCDFELKPTAMLSPSDVDRLKTLAAVASQYAAIEPVLGMGLTGRYLLAALDAGSAEDLAVALAMEITLRGVQEDEGACKKMLHCLDRVADRDPSPRVAAWHALGWASYLTMTGRSRQAEARIEESLQRFADVPVVLHWEASFLRYVESMACCGTMRVDHFARVAREIEERRAAGERASEVRLTAFLIPYFHLQCGRSDLAVAAAADSEWSAVTSRQTGIRRYCRFVAAWAALCEGRVDVEWKEALAHWDLLVESDMVRSTMARGEALRILASCAHVAGRPDLARDAARRFGRARTPMQRCFSSWIHAIAAYSADDSDGAARQLAVMAHEAGELGYEALEAIALFGLARLRTGVEADAAREQLDAIVRGRGVIDVDLYLWSHLPIGERPERRGAPC
ncbi:MAG: protein kinase [Polyangiales bacterium]